MLNRFQRGFVVAATATLTSATALAMPMVMGFEGVVPAGGSTVPVTPYTETGFTLTNSLGGGTDGIFSATGAVNTNGTDIFGWCSSCGPLTMTLSKSGGGAFNFLSFDSAVLQGGGINSLDVIGNLLGGGTVSVAITQTNIWTTHALLGFSNVTSVDFAFGVNHVSSGNHAFDNLTMSTGVPEPSSLALVGLALAGLGVARRRALRA